MRTWLWHKSHMIKQRQCQTSLMTDQWDVTNYDWCNEDSHHVHITDMTVTNVTCCWTQGPPAKQNGLQLKIHGFTLTIWPVSYISVHSTVNHSVQTTHKAKQTSQQPFAWTWLGPLWLDLTGTIVTGPGWDHCDWTRLGPLWLTWLGPLWLDLTGTKVARQCNVKCPHLTATSSNKSHMVTSNWSQVIGH